MMDKAELTREIKRKAIELGFSKVGIAKAQELKDEAIKLSQWLERRYEADMEWMRKSFEKRINPALVLPGAKSIISVALNYFQKLPQNTKRRR
jgi:epoxyqueuosine reductase